MYLLYLVAKVIQTLLSKLVFTVLTVFTVTTIFHNQTDQIQIAMFKRELKYVSSGGKTTV